MERIRMNFTGCSNVGSAYRERHAGRKIPFTNEELFTLGPPKTYTGKYLNEIAFPARTL